MMKFLRYIVLTAAALSAGIVLARAQFYMNGLSNYNNGGLVSYYDDSAMVTASGSYTAVAGALTLHGGNTLLVDGPYTASGNSVDSFAGDGSASWPPVDAAKTIAGSVAPTFDMASFANGAGQLFNITNTAGTNIAQSLSFVNGITTTIRANTETGALRFLDNATYANTALGDAQHINGYVSKTGDDVFIYPVGSGTDLRTLSISAPATATDQYSVAWIVGDPGTNGDPSNANAMHSTAAVTGPIASVSIAGQWDWIPVSGTGAGLIITVSIPDLSATGVLAANLRLVGWNGTAWVDLSGGPTASGNTEGATLSGTMIAGITAIGIGSTSIELPVIFSSFAARKQSCEAVLNWVTASEQNNSYFTIERSIDGRSFAAIGSITVQGNSTEAKHYSFTDKQPLEGYNYYRIVQTDIDGKSTHTTVRVLQFNCTEDAIKVYPTVNNGIVYVSLPEGYEHASISVYTTLGQKIRLPVESVNSNLRTLRLQSLSAATYMIRVANGENVQTFKIIYQP